MSETIKISDFIPKPPNVFEPQGYTDSVTGRNVKLRFSDHGTISVTIDGRDLEFNLTTGECVGSGMCGSFRRVSLDDFLGIGEPAKTIHDDP